MGETIFPGKFHACDYECPGSSCNAAQSFPSFRSNSEQAVESGRGRGDSETAEI